MSINIEAIADRTLQMMQDVGFDDSHVCITVSERDELNVAHNDPSLLRSTEDYSVSLVGILDGRKASSALTDFDERAIEAGVKGLFERVHSAPQDDANAVSANQVGHYDHGPMGSNLDLLADKVDELLDFRAREAGKVTMEEGGSSHRVSRSVELTSQGTRLSFNVGSFELSAMGTASENGRSSSFNYSGGRSDDLSTRHASEWFAIGDMLRDTQNQIDTKPIPQRFTGSVLLAPSAVSDLVGWFLAQLSSGALIADSSIFKDKVGEQVAVAGFNLSSYFDAPGHVPFTTDGYLANPLTVVEGGRLNTLLLDQYGSRKTGLLHTPATSGWRIAPGSDAKSDLISGIPQGALVNRLSMGSPAANGDFSGVIKNSFIITDGKPGPALSDTMVSGNMAKMLLAIDGISAEHIDYGGEDFPFLRVPGLHFS